MNEFDLITGLENHQKAVDSLAPKLRKAYLKVEKKLESAFVAGGQIDLSPEKRAEVIAQVEHGVEAIGAYEIAAGLVRSGGIK